MQSNPGASISSNKELKSKGLLSMMLSLPEDWNYTTRGLAACKSLILLDFHRSFNDTPTKRPPAFR